MHRCDSQGRLQNMLPQTMEADPTLLTCMPITVEQPEVQDANGVDIFHAEGRSAKIAAVALHQHSSVTPEGPHLPATADMHTTSQMCAVRNPAGAGLVLEVTDSCRLPNCRTSRPARSAAVVAHTEAVLPAGMAPCPTAQLSSQHQQAGVTSEMTASCRLHHAHPGMSGKGSCTPRDAGRQASPQR